MMAKAKAALSETGNERIKPGGNNPPVFDAHKANIDDLREEAGAWLDGKAVENADEAEGINTLLDLARQAVKAADEARSTEKKPHLDAAKAVDAQWKPLIDAGQRVVDCCKKALTPWNIKEAERKAAEAARARAEAEAEARAAREAEIAASGALSDADQAEQLAWSAKQAAKIAKSAEKAASTGLGLRTTYRAELTDINAAVKHYWAVRRESFEDLVTDLAAQDVRAGKRQIPGFNIIEEKKAF